MPWTNKSSSLFQGLCVYTGKQLQHSAGFLFHSLYFLLVQNLKFNKRLDFLRSSWACIQPYHMHRSTNSHGLPNFQEYVGDFQRPLLMPLFPSKLLRSLLSAITLLSFISFFIYLANTPEEKAFLLWMSFKPCYIKTALQVGSSRELLDR